MFLVGGAVSVWEGINALLEPRELDYFWVGVGVIGLLLAFLATRLARRNRELITNQAVPARYVERLRTRLEAQPGIAAVPRLEAVYIGASDVLVAADVLMEPGLDSEGAAQALASARTRIQQEVPVVARLYLTPVPNERG